MINQFLNLAYLGASPMQKLDLYLPDECRQPYPFIVFIHGGAFLEGDKRDSVIESWLSALRAGYAVASVNYRLSGEALFPAGLQDIKAAIRFLKGNADAFHLDRSKAIACGESAGGHYAAMVCFTADNPDFDDLNDGYKMFSSSVTAAVDWYGPSDFLSMDEHLILDGLGPANHSAPDSPDSMLLGAALTSVPDLAKKASPISYVRKGLPPILIQHGSKDNVVSCRQSVALFEALEKAGGNERSELDIFQGAAHSDPVFEKDENMNRIIEFLNKNIRGLDS